MYTGSIKRLVDGSESATR